MTAAAALIVNVQVPVPLHPPPLQPAKDEPPVGVAVSVTCCPELKLALQVTAQLMPLGLLVTVPLPPPPIVTVSANPIVTLTGDDAIPLATTTSWLGPLSVFAARVKLLVPDALGATLIFVKPKVLA